VARFKWTMKAKGRYVDSGTMEASSESEAINLAMLEQLEKDRDPDECYSFSCGTTATNSYGDEFARSAGASSIDDSQMDSSGHTFAPSLADVGIEPDADQLEAGAKKVAEAMAGAAAQEILRQVLVDNLGIAADQLEGLGDAAEECSKTFEDCRDKFNNAQNYGAWDPNDPCPWDFKSESCGYDQAQGGTSDAIVARALESGKRGDAIKVRFLVDPNGSSGYGTGTLGADAEIGEGLRAGADNLYYPPKYPSGRMAARGPNLQQLPNPTAGGDALRKALEATPVDTGAARKTWAIRGAEAQKAFEESMETDGDFVASVVFPKLNAEELAVQDEAIRLRERLAKSQGIPHDSGEIRKVWINDEEIFPGPRKLGPTVTRTISTWGDPSSITCEAPHCQEVIPIGHLPMGTTSGVPCPGCDATYSVMRN